MLLRSPWLTCMHADSLRAACKTSCITSNGDCFVGGLIDLCGFSFQSCAMFRYHIRATPYIQQHAINQFLRYRKPDRKLQQRCCVELPEIC